MLVEVVVDKVVIIHLHLVDLVVVVLEKLDIQMLETLEFMLLEVAVVEEEQFHPHNLLADLEVKVLSS
jgi:hypothetical protein